MAILILGYTVAFANAVMAALISFNVLLTQTQSAAVDGLINAGGILLIAIFTAINSKKAGKITTPVAAPPRSNL